VRVRSWVVARPSPATRQISATGRLGQDVENPVEASAQLESTEEHVFV